MISCNRCVEFSRFCILSMNNLTFLRDIALWYEMEIYIVEGLFEICLWACLFLGIFLRTQISFVHSPLRFFLCVYSSGVQFTLFVTAVLLSYFSIYIHLYSYLSLCPLLFTLPKVLSEPGSRQEYENDEIPKNGGRLKTPNTEGKTVIVQRTKEEDGI